jgi:hypothetical protein
MIIAVFCQDRPLRSTRDWVEDVVREATGRATTGDAVR